MMDQRIINSFLQKEKGCILYQLFKEKGKEMSYAMIETWETAEVWEIYK